MSSLLRCAECGRVMLEASAFLSLKGKVCGRCFGAPVEMPPGPALTPEKRAAAMALVEREYQDLAGQLARQQQAIMNDSNANLAQQACTDQARKQQFSPMVAAYETRDANLSADLDAARKRIAELEASVEEQAALADKWRTLAKRADSYVSDANDAAGTLRTERDDLLRENAVLRRKLEADERKAGKR